MSWQVDGVWYHDRDKYEVALARREARIAGEAANQLRGAIAGLQENIRQREADVAAARGDVHRQTALNEALRADVGRLDQLRREAAAQQQQAAENFRAQLDAVRGENRVTGEALRSLVQEVEEQSRQTEAAFAGVRRDLDAGLAEAERRREASEARLREGIDEAHRAIEREREQRLARHQDRLQQAAEQIRLTEADLEALKPHLPPLALREQADAVVRQLEQARGMIERGESAASLAMAYGAFTATLTLGDQVRKRRAELDAARGRVTAEVGYLRSLLKDDLARRYFTGEIERIGALLTRLEQRAAAEYADYATLAIEAKRDGEFLQALVHQSLRIVQSAPVMKDMADERREIAETLLTRLAEINGPATDVQQRFARDGDRKSPLVMTCRFGEATIEARVTLNGTVSLDGYGYESNSACTQQGQAILESLGGRQEGRTQLDTQNRQRAVPRNEAAVDTWQTAEAEISRLEDRL